MSGYGTARTIARQLGLAEAASLLQQTLDEENAADQELTRSLESIGKHSGKTSNGQRHALRACANVRVFVIYAPNHGVPGICAFRAASSFISTPIPGRSVTVI